jgi:hypothetical protein
MTLKPLAAAAIAAALLAAGAVGLAAWWAYRPGGSKR